MEITEHGVIFNQNSFLHWDAIRKTWYEYDALQQRPHKVLVVSSLTHNEPSTTIYFDSQDMAVAAIKAIALRRATN